MFKTILRGLQVLVTGKKFVDSLSQQRQAPIQKVPDPFPNLQHPAASCEKKKRSPDRTKLTVEQIQYVKDQYISMQKHNVGLSWSEHVTTMELTSALNHALGLHKSRTFYSTIWNDKTKEESVKND